MAMENRASSVSAEKKHLEQKIDQVQPDARKKKLPAPTLEMINIEGCLSTTKAILM
ncbi:hypothetical protein [Pseudomonas gozinkensis]|uniref:hypothetical protein n=1 Tax=Pseudomonas gozinkensis TaxID=2774461 RepID=UPI0017885DA4|nr:hypothetical protein [Pseudomonas gozinkensis]